MLATGTPWRLRQAAWRQAAEQTRWRPTGVKGRVQIGPRYSVNSQLKAYAPRDPGEPLDGVWQYLYPKRFTVQSPGS